MRGSICKCGEIIAFKDKTQEEEFTSGMMGSVNCPKCKAYFFFNGSPGSIFLSHRPALEYTIAKVEEVDRFDCLVGY
jgi:hypothetical protein